MLTPQLPSPESPGSMAPTLRQIQSLERCGVDVEIIEMRGVPVLKYAAGYRKMRKLLRDVDLIHAHYGYCGWLARSQFRKPIVVSFMGSDVYGDQNGSGRSDWLSSFMAYSHCRWLAPLANSVIVKSRQMADLVAPTPSHIVANGVDVEAFHPEDSSAARQKLGWKLDRRYVLFPGNPENPRKGFALAREAIETLNAKLVRPVELVALWNVSPDEVANYMNASDAMLMVSIAEGSPNVVKEALACNCPIVAVPVGDVATLLDGVEGCVVCEREAVALANALCETLSRGERSQGRATIEHRCLDVESVARRVVGIYQDVLARTGSSESVPVPDSFGSEAS